MRGDVERKFGGTCNVYAEHFITWNVAADLMDIFLVTIRLINGCITMAILHVGFIKKYTMVINSYMWASPKSTATSVYLPYFLVDLVIILLRATITVYQIKIFSYSSWNFSVGFNAFQYTCDKICEKGPSWSNFFFISSLQAFDMHYCKNWTIETKVTTS